MENYPSIMIDLETLGVNSDAVILSIGAVKFNPATGQLADEAFYRSISVDSNTAVGRSIDEATLLWWMNQGKDAQRVFSEEKIPLNVALDELTSFFDRTNYLVWSNGADFDIPMLAHAFRAAGMPTPWKFWNARCFRTMKNLPCAAGTEVLAFVEHNALGDAYAQAQQLCNIYNRMKTETL